MKFNFTVKGLQVNGMVPSKGERVLAPVVSVDEIGFNQDFQAEELIALQNNSLANVKKILDFATDVNNLEKIMDAMDAVDEYVDLKNAQEDAKRKKAHAEKELRRAQQTPYTAKDVIKDADDVMANFEKARKANEEARIKFAQEASKKDAAITLLDVFNAATQVMEEFAEKQGKDTDGDVENNNILAIVKALSGQGK